MSKRLIQDLHASISRRDWAAVEAAANRLRDDIEKTIAILAGTGIGSLPNDYPLSDMVRSSLSSPVEGGTEKEETDGARTVVIGEETIAQLRAGKSVSAGRVYLLPASDLACTTYIATVENHNDAFDPADEAFGGAFKDGFREGWLFAKSPDFEDRDEAEEDYPREVDMAPSECWDAYRSRYFAKLPLAAIPEVGAPIASPSAEIEALRVENERLVSLASHYDEILRVVCHHLELPQSESGPADDLSLYDRALEASDVMYRRTEAERVEHKNARYKAEAEIAFLAKEARRYASQYPEASDGRNTFIIFAEMIERRSTLQQQGEGR